MLVVIVFFVFCMFVMNILFCLLVNGFFTSIIISAFSSISEALHLSSESDCDCCFRRSISIGNTAFLKLKVVTLKDSK